MPSQARIIKAHVQVDEQRERARVRPQQRLALPSPRPAAAAIAIAVTVVEVQAGVRSPWHLERVSHYSLWPVWDRFARPAPPDPAATAARPLVVLIQELTPGLVDATVIVQFAGGVEPLALTLDGARGWWELMELECPTDITPDLSPDGLELATSSQADGQCSRVPDHLTAHPNEMPLGGLPTGHPRTTTASSSGSTARASTSDRHLKVDSLLHKASVGAYEVLRRASARPYLAGGAVPTAAPPLRMAGRVRRRACPPAGSCVAAR